MVKGVKDKVKIVVVRHGETKYNKEHIVCGISDSPLTEAGCAQADRLRLALSNYTFDAIYTSPLVRAINTARIINVDDSRTPITIDERLKERNYGDYEGVNEEIESFTAIKWQFGMKMPGQNGESIFQMIQRVYNFLDQLKECDNLNTVLIVCHCGICRIIYSYFCSITNKMFEDYYINNCDFQEYEL